VIIPKPIIYVLALMLLVGAFPMPYGYYTLLRFGAFIVFGLLAYDVFSRGGKLLPWVLGFIAILFNPFIKVHLPKELWSVIDVVTAVILVATIKYTSPLAKSPE
jgi:hypothetical protein